MRNCEIRMGGRVLSGAAAVAMGALLVQGCGNGLLNNGGSTISPALATTYTSMLLTDAPADQVLALGLTVDSIVLTDQAGAAITVLSTPTNVEISHLNAVQEQLLPPLKVPQDTYVSATITVAAPTVVYVDPTTRKPVTVSAALSNATTTVTFTQPITVTATSTPLVVDLLAGQSVAISGTAVTVTPTFNVFQIPLSSRPTNGSNGRMDGVLGQVVSVSSTGLVVATAAGQQVTIATDSQTVFQGVSQLSALAVGELVDVDVAHQTNGNLLALRVHLLAQNGQALLVGPVTAVTGSPATGYTQVVHQPLAAGRTGATATVAVSVSGATAFGLAAQAGTLPSLPFTPVFSAATMVAGQDVETVAATLNATALTATAASVTLHPQTVGGTVSTVTVVNSGLTAYTVALPAGSALGSLSGATSVVVYVSSATQATNAAPIAVGSTVRFNGLLFNDNGTLRMVAGASCDGPGTVPPQKRR